MLRHGTTIVTLGLFDCNAISTADALVAAYTATNSQLANIDLKWNTVDTVTAIFIKYLAGIANNKTIEGEDRFYDASLEGTIKLDGGHYAADFDALEFQEITPSHMEGYKEAVTTIFNKPLRAFFVDKLYIPFADAKVIAVLAAHGVGTNDGITMDQILAVTSIGTWFNNIQNVSTFNEFELFTGVKTIEAYAFRYSSLTRIKFPSSITSISSSSPFGSCNILVEDLYLPNLKTMGTFTGCRFGKISSLGSITSMSGSFTQCGAIAEITLPSTLTSIGDNTFNKAQVTKMIILADTPPLLSGSPFRNTNGPSSIYVPDTAVDTYKAASVWTTYASRIHPMSELPE